jgi:UDPglucose--hexose-1-phosphate uridylyltransferase
MPLRKHQITKPDGRYLIYYSFEGRAAPEPVAAASDAPQEPKSGRMELRWHPLLEEWVIVATHRQERTFLPPAEYCPLCPTHDPSFPTEVPASDYEFVVFENRFPSLRRDAPDPAPPAPPYAAAAARGVCEVVLYSPDHDSTLGAMPLPVVRRLVDVWVDRYRELASRPEIAYVFIFENRGREIGVTLTHPHGQIYSFPYVPPRVERELAAAARFRAERGRCVYCAVLERERAEKTRLVAENDSFTAFVPYFARLPYEVHLVSRSHRSSLVELSARERGGLADLLKTVLLKYDNLWGFPMPFTMVMHQQPTDGREHPDCHFHIEFAPPYRSRDKLKYLAGCETGAGSFINDTLPEEKAEELRWAEPRT